MALILVVTACDSGTVQSKGLPSQATRLVATITVGQRAGTAAIGGGYTWVPNTADGTISKIDSKTDRVVATIRIADAQKFWQDRCGDASVHSFPVGNFDVRRCDLPSAIAFYEGSLWVLRNDTSELLRIDPRSDQVVGSIPLHGEPFGLGAGPTGLWVTDFQNDTVTRVDPSAGTETKILPAVGLGPSGVLPTRDGVWVALSRENSVLRLDSATGMPVAKIAVGNRPLAMAETEGAIWVRNEKSSSLARIDPRTNRLVATVPIDAFFGRDGQDGLAVVGGKVWTSGLALDQVDPATNSVARRFVHSAITLGGAGSSIWATDLEGTVSRIEA